MTSENIIKRRCFVKGEERKGRKEGRKRGMGEKEEAEE